MAGNSVVRMLVVQGSYLFGTILMLIGIILWMRRVFHWGQLVMMAGWLFMFLLTVLNSLSMLILWATEGVGMPREVSHLLWTWIAPALSILATFLLGLGLIIAGNAMRKASPAPVPAPSPGYAPPLPAGGWQRAR